MTYPVIEQEAYRERHHFRAAWLREDGSIVWVDDLTFNPAIHSEKPLAPPRVLVREVA